MAININLNAFDNDQNKTQVITLEGTNGTTFSVEFGGQGSSYFEAEPTTGTFGEEGTATVNITFNGPEATNEEQTIGATLIYTIGTAESVSTVISGVVAATTSTDPIPDPVDPEEPETEEEEEEEVNDFFSRKDVNGEVIRVFEEDYWPVDFVNVEPDKFAIMPGEGITQDCMFGDSTIPAETTTNVEPEGTGN